MKCLAFLIFSPDYFHMSLTLCVSSQSSAPKAPSIIPEECSAENNGVTIAWQPPPTSYVEGYVLELDDGSGGDFRVSYTCRYLVFI